MNEQPKILLFTVILLLVLASVVFGQAEETDHVAAQTDSVRKNMQHEEFILNEILIEGVVEKPNVTILPSRKETEFSEIDFINRSFVTDLQALPDRSHLPGEWRYEPIFQSHLREILTQDKKKFIQEY